MYFQWTSGDQGSILFTPGARLCMNLGEILECLCASVGPAVSRVHIFLLGQIVGLLYHCNTKVPVWLIVGTTRAVQILSYLGEVLLLLSE